MAPIIDISAVMEDIVFSAISNLKSSFSCSVDGITAKTIKVQNWNLAKSDEIVSSEYQDENPYRLLEVALITPLYKNADASDENNFRPILVLPTLGKLLLMSNTQPVFSMYLTANNLLSKHSFGEGRSTGFHLVIFLNHEYGEIDQEGSSGVLFVDLTKAFDTEDHTIVL